MDEQQLTKVDLNFKTKISKIKINKILSGKHDFSLKEIRKIENALNIKILKTLENDPMKWISYVHSIRPEAGNREPKINAFCLNELSERRFLNESKEKMERPSLGLCVDEETFNWFQQHQDNGIVEVTPNNAEKIKSFHFYKEISGF